MKKILLIAMLSIEGFYFGQIGMGTPDPRGALDINKGTTNDMGLILPTNDNVNNIVTPDGGNIVPGTVIYDSSNDCVKHYKGTNAWSGCIPEGSTTSPIGGGITDLDCSTPTNTGILYSGNQASGVSSSIPYTGGSGITHSGQVVYSEGVGGLTATLLGGSFATGNGNLTYTITGTPVSDGVASFALNIGSKRCFLTRNVVAPNIESLDCAGANHSGALLNGAPASGVTSTISYTGGDASAHQGQTVGSTGVEGLTATVASGNFTAGNGSLVYTITGTPSAAGIVVFEINIGGRSCTLTRVVSR